MTPERLTAIGTLVLAAGTIILAAVAIFPDTIRRWFYRPSLRASVQTSPPDCVKTYVSLPDGTPVANAFYIRIWIRNTGNLEARNVEVYANELLKEYANRQWERVMDFPPMNLKWSNSGVIYWPIIVPGMGKHCDVGHVVDPAHRTDPRIQEENPKLGLAVQQTSLAFDLMVGPNTKGHIVGPGEYRLKILIAAQNARRREQTVFISLKGSWDADETRMLQNGLGVSVS
jgi:hypothetical protein